MATHSTDSTNSSGSSNLCLQDQQKYDSIGSHRTTATTTTTIPIVHSKAMSKKVMSLSELLNLTKQNVQNKRQHQQQNQQEQQQSASVDELAIEEQRQQMELSQIELIYRAEGNANLVLALPQFKKVLRLPKMLSTNRHQQQQKQSEPQLLPSPTPPPPQQQLQLQLQSQLEQVQQPEKQQEQMSTVDSIINQNVKAVDDLRMEDFVAYIDVIRRLLGNEFIFETDIVKISKEVDRIWINEHIKPARPAHRLNKEFCGQFGLLLPDATQLPNAFDSLLSNLQPKTKLTGDTYAVEIKPKQGWLLPNDVDDLFHMNEKTRPTEATKSTCKEIPLQCATTSRDKNTTASMDVPSGVAVRKKAKTDTRCRYCAMQYLKLKNKKIKKLSSYCPMELFSGMPTRMSAAVQALFECPQNNLRFFHNGNLIYGDHSDSMSWMDLNQRIFHGNKLELIKHLVVECLLRNYQDVGETTEISGAENLVEIDDVGDTATAAVTNVNVKREFDVVATVTGQMQQPHTSSASTHLLKDASIMPDTETIAQKALLQLPTQAHFNDVEMLCLPKNCVLQKVQHLQLLAKHNLNAMFAAGYAQKAGKTYHTLYALCQKLKDDNTLSFDSLSYREQYLLGATALDCSIMLTFQEISANELSSSKYPNVVRLPRYDKCFLTKVTLLDLDPKPDSHFAKYIKQTKEINECCQEQVTAVVDC